METCKFLCFHVILTCKHKDMHVSMYFLHLVLPRPFISHYIIMVKGHGVRSLMSYTLPFVCTCEYKHPIKISTP